MHILCVISSQKCLHLCMLLGANTVFITAVFESLLFTGEISWENTSKSPCAPTGCDTLASKPLPYI